MIHASCDLDQAWYAESVSIHIQVGIWSLSDPAFTFTAISLLALVYDDWLELSQVLLWRDTNSYLC